VLYRTPIDLDVARFVGEAVVVPGEARGRSVTCLLGTLAIRGEEHDGPVQVMIRPEQIRLQPQANGHASARVVGKSFYGAATELHLELQDGAATPVVARTFDEPGVDVGDRTSVAVEGPVTVYEP
jgi:iron(III) transport system ATP-binding protein